MERIPFTRKEFDMVPKANQKVVETVKIKQKFNEKIMMKTIYPNTCLSTEELLLTVVKRKVSDCSLQRKSNRCEFKFCRKY
jgi:hypothetical protein